MNTVENYIAPGSIEEAAAALAAGPVTIVAGGTDLMLQTGSGAIAYAKTLMNVRRIAEMQGVSIDGDTIRIGALTTITELKSDAIIAEHLPVVAEMADKFASDQIRNASTIGGNICNASPAGDGIVPLMMYGADVVLASAKGNRNVALSEFFTGPGKTVKADNELLVAIEIAKPAAGFKGGFGKFGPRPALEIAMASVALGGVVKDGVISNVSVAFGAVGPTPMMGAKTTALLEGKTLNEETISAAGEAASEEVTPIDDVRASAWYRRHLIRVMTEEILNDVG